MLRSTWVEQKHAKLYTDAYEMRRAETVSRLEGLSMSELVEKSPQPNWLLAIFIDQYKKPPPASEATISAVEVEIGHTLPADYREFLAIRNGHYNLGLLPIESVRSASDVDEWQRDYALDAANEALQSENSISAAELDRCWVIGGMVFDGEDENAPEQLSASAYWCPEQDDDWQYIGVHANRVFTSFTELLRSSIADTSFFF